MGDRLRKYLAQLLQIAFQAALPGIIIYSILLGSFVLQGTPRDDKFTPLIYLQLMLSCYLTAFIATCIIKYRTLFRAALRTDEHLVGKNFGGFRRQDRLFCCGLDAYSKNHPRVAVELFLDVQNYELTESETGVLSFYIGRCYHLLSCPSHAIPYYQKARENGFSEPFSMLFEARSCADSGDFTGSLQLYQTLLEHEPPPEFYFLYTDIGYLYIRQQQPETAVKWFRQSIEKRQNYAFALSGMAIASLQCGDFADAQEYMYKALINRLDDPNHFRNYFAETKNLMLAQHPGWDDKTGRHPAEPDDETDDRDDETDEPEEGA